MKSFLAVQQSRRLPIGTEVIQMMVDGDEMKTAPSWNLMENGMIILVMMNINTYANENRCSKSIILPYTVVLQETARTMGSE